MRLNAFLLASCLLAFTLSGCAQEPAEPTSTDDLDLEQVNAAPVADLRADLTNGTAPMNVTFTLEGSDDDADNLTWTFDAGDGNTTANGTDLPASVNATYGVGNWTATFSVSDGKNTTVTTLLVTVLAGVDAPEAPEAPEAPAVPEPIVFTGSALVPSVTMYTGLGCIDGYGIGQSSDGEYRAMPDEDVTGWAFAVNSGFYVFIYDGDLNTLAEGTSGEVPEGADTVDICSETAVAADYELVFTHPDYQG